MTATIYEPERLVRWTRPGSYFGAEWPTFYSSGFGQNRDSGPLERANFKAAPAKEVLEDKPF